MSLSLFIQLESRRKIAVILNDILTRTKLPNLFPWCDPRKKITFWFRMTMTYDSLSVFSVFLLVKLVYFLSIVTSWLFEAHDFFLPFLHCRWRLFDVLEFRQRRPDFAGRRHLRWSRFDVWMVHGNLWKNGRTRRFPGRSGLCLTLFESTARRHPGKNPQLVPNFPSLITLDNAQNYLMVSL